MKKQTNKQYCDTIEICKEIFKKKNQDYGTAWRILRLPSITDQIYIKAQRIRSIQEKGEQKIEDNIKEEFMGIINYCIMALIQMGLDESCGLELSYDFLAPLYDDVSKRTMDLLTDKNHDYDEAWREMRVSSMTDIILMKLLRIKQIENNVGRTLVSESIDANYQDMINYSVFCIIKLNEEES